MPVLPAMKSQKSSTIAPVLVGADPADARRGALADVAEQARPADLAGPLEDAALQVRTGKTRSSRSSVSRIAQAWAYGPK